MGDSCFDHNTIEGRLLDAMITFMTPRDEDVIEKHLNDFINFASKNPNKEEVNNYLKEHVEIEFFLDVFIEDLEKADGDIIMIMKELKEVLEDILE